MQKYNLNDRKHANSKFRRWTGEHPRFDETTQSLLHYCNVINICEWGGDHDLPKVEPQWWGGFLQTHYLDEIKAYQRISSLLIENRCCWRADMSIKEWHSRIFIRFYLMSQNKFTESNVWKVYMKFSNRIMTADMWLTCTSYQIFTAHQ